MRRGSPEPLSITKPYLDAHNDVVIEASRTTEGEIIVKNARLTHDQRLDHCGSNGRAVMVTSELIV